jgi:hypothetical protein
VGNFHSQGKQSDAIQMLTFCFGCYYGEVLVRHHRAIWKMPAETNLPEQLKEDNNIMYVVFPNGNVLNPIGKAFRLLEDGLGDSLVYSYHVAKTELINP